MESPQPAFIFIYSNTVSQLCYLAAHDRLRMGRDSACESRHKLARCQRHRDRVLLSLLSALPSLSSNAALVTVLEFISCALRCSVDMGYLLSVILALTATSVSSFLAGFWLVSCKLFMLFLLCSVSELCQSNPIHFK